jgi:SAM-dependent methyltransferase
MKRCLACDAVFEAASDHCPACDWQPERKGGFDAYSPALDGTAEGFKPQYFEPLAALESSNFWFRIRNELILLLVREHFANVGNVLEIGCGTGFVLSALASELPKARIFGSEVHTRGLEFAAKRVPRAHLMQMDARDIPFREEFDLIGAFDVVEHIEEDDWVLRQMSTALRPGGGVLLTVPQHMVLWSEQDIAACHVRRYLRGELEGKLVSAGFRVLRSTSFVTLLFPLLLASRRATRSGHGEFNPSREFRMHPALNRTLYAIQRMEYHLISAGISLPFGGTRLIAAIKDPS